MDGAEDRREGRGHLSSIDRLPEEAEPDIIWALEQLRERKLPQTVILMEFNERLVDKGIEPISKSSFSRYAVRKAIEFRKMDEARRMAAELNAVFDAESSDEVTILVAELIKTGMQTALMDNRDMSPKGFMEMARSLQAVVSAQKGSAELRRRLQQEVQERLEKAAADVEAAGKKQGIDAETLGKVTKLLTTGTFE